MSIGKDDHLFISYSHKDIDIYREVRQSLLDQATGAVIEDDTDIRASERRDPKLEQMMTRARLAVVILSNHYFRRRGKDRDYILEKELPLLLERYQRGEDRKSVV